MIQRGMVDKARRWWSPITHFCMESLTLQIALLVPNCRRWSFLAFLVARRLESAQIWYRKFESPATGANPREEAEFKSDERPGGEGTYGK